MITHDMQLMLDYSDRALVMVDGELIADTDPASLLSNPELLVKANLKETSIFNLAKKTRRGSTCFNGILQRKERRMQAKLIGYQHRDTVIHRLSGAGKLLFFILVSLAAMISYDIRLLVLIAIFSIFLLYLSEIRFKDVSFVAVFATVFAILNVLMVYLFSPEYGVGLYGERSVIWQGIGAYTLTSQELFYLLNLAIKYLCTIPLAIIFLMTTHPSQFASSLNQIGVPYKIAYSVSLTLRYIPDLQEEFFTIKMSQEARGMELSKKASLMQRIKGNLRIITPFDF